MIFLHRVARYEGPMKRMNRATDVGVNVVREHCYEVGIPQSKSGNETTPCLGRQRSGISGILDGSDIGRS